MTERIKGARRPPRAIIVHSLADARAALGAARALGVPITLRSAPGAAGYAGPGWWRALAAAAAGEFPDVAMTAVLDCADARGDAMAALRAGVGLIRLTAPKRVRAAIAAMAAEAGARLDEDRSPALDLAGASDAEAACHAWLGGGQRGRKRA